MPQHAWSIHCTENCLQLSNNPLVYLRSTPRMEPLGAQRCSARTDIVSTYLTRDLWSVKIPRLKESAPLGAHLNRMKGEYAPVWISDVDKRMNPISSMNCLQTQKSIKHQYVKQERDQMLPKVSSIKENIVTTILQPIYKSLSKWRLSKITSDLVASGWS